MTDLLFVAHDLEPADLREVERVSSRLAQRGYQARVLCATGGAGHPGVAEAPGLSRGWRRPWTARRLATSADFPLPDLLHGIRPDTADIVLDLAETWRRPYLLAVDEFLAPGTRLRLSRRWCRGIITVSNDLADDLVRHLGIPRRWIELVHPSVDRPLGTDSNRVEVPGRVLVVGTVASVAPAPGMATFFDAARRVVARGVDAEFVVSGADRVESGLRRLAAHFGIGERVTFADDRDDGRTFWSVLDLYCQPSTRASTGRSLSTAMACGLPVIASNVAGLRSWIHHGENGLLVPPGDSEAMAEAILDLLTTPARGWRLGREALESVILACDPEEQANRLDRLYTGALEETDETIPARSRLNPLVESAPEASA